MHYDFVLAGRRVRLWQKAGEGYDHILLKALAYAMFVGEYPNIEIETRVGLRYKPDLVALNGDPAGPRFLFWGECGLVTVRKVAWLLKHGDAERLALFKIGFAAGALARQLREAVGPRHRGRGRLVIFNFVPDVAERASGRRIERVPESWYNTIPV